MSETKILAEHKHMLMISGNLSDFQITNMKTWPYIFFNNVESVELDYDFSGFTMANVSPKPGQVVYNIKTSNLENIEQSKEMLESATKMLFWPETEVVINVV